MLSRAFEVMGLVVRIAEWKATMLGFSVKRSAIAMLGYLIAAIVALGGMVVLLGAGYVALEAIAGVAIALSAVGVSLLLIASIIVIIANRRGRSTGHAPTEEDVRESAASDEELLRARLRLSNKGAKQSFEGPASQSDAVKGLENPKVAMAAGFALLGLVGPGRLFRTVRIATALWSMAALAHRAINEHGDKKATPGSPSPPDAGSNGGGTTPQRGRRSRS